MLQSQISRSCDRCHVLKERCSSVDGSDRCERCLRLNHDCLRRRVRRQPGRPKRSSPALQRNESHKEPSQGATAATAAAAAVRDDRNTATHLSSMLDWAISRLGIAAVDAKLLRQGILGDNLALDLCVGPTFAAKYRHHIVSHLFASPETLGHASLACALAWSDSPSLSPASPISHLGSKTRSASCKKNVPCTEQLYRYATSAIATLRSMSPRNVSDMSLCVALGDLISAFALKLHARDAQALCRQTLDLIKPIYYDDGVMGAAGPDDILLVAGMALTHLAESLYSCQPPTLRYKMMPQLRSSFVDPSLGVAWGILPYLYDIGQLNHCMLKDSMALGSHDSVLQKNHESLRQLTRHVRDWRPDIPDNFASSFTTTEVSHMLCQVEVFRTAALLILHRLQHAFSSDDALGQAMSLHILTLLETTKMVTKSICRSVDLPLTAACLELRNPEDGDRLLRLLSPLSSFSDPFHDRRLELLTAVWSASETSPGLYWYDIGSTIGPILTADW